LRVCEVIFCSSLKEEEEEEEEVRLKKEGGKWNNREDFASDVVREIESIGGETSIKRGRVWPAQFIRCGVTPLPNAREFAVG